MTQDASRSWDAGYASSSIRIRSGAGEVSMLRLALSSSRMAEGAIRLLSPRVERANLGGIADLGDYPFLGRVAQDDGPGALRPAPTLRLRHRERLIELIL